MKMIEAIIQPDCLEPVKRELRKRDVSKMTVFHVKGCGKQMGYTESYRGQTHEVNLMQKVCIRVAVNDEFVRPVVDAIIEGARTGEIGDGKIFIQPLEECIRIRTGEEGSDAIG
ncbi:MAG: P-II family nitrogen regulator [Spirochaetales bacterium]|nr:P-II family nitrogen regulator [Spirochaetales bacterium]